MKQYGVCFTEFFVAYFLQHDNVAMVTKFVAEAGHKLYMVMDCRSTTTLLELMRYKNHKSLTLDTRLSYYKQSGEGMAYLHQRKFIHGFLQAKGIYVTSDNRVSVTNHFLLRLCYPSVSWERITYSAFASQPTVARMNSNGHFSDIPIAICCRL